jgi:hypothetical protein
LRVIYYIQKQKSSRKGGGYVENPEIRSDGIRNGTCRVPLSDEAKHQMILTS